MPQSGPATETGLVTDTTILLSAILSKNERSIVRSILETWEGKARFCTPVTCVAEARDNLIRLSHKFTELATRQSILDEILRIVKPIPLEGYIDEEATALWLIGPRHPKDWPVLALARATGFPIWTSDRDFSAVV